MTRQTKQTEIMRSKGYISASETAEKVGKSIATIYRWLEEGFVEGTQLGRSWFVKLDSLIKYLGPESAEMLGLNEKPSSDDNDDPPAATEEP